ncbi:MAG: dihydrolipoyllysine-residue acetyltransferase [Candidatus Eremiobacteraeota bacterium]|nr:dihydrolipoyllysine-residue acetyltransferase [Candidatus Eremiobacteraeota bacterium]
MADTIDITVPDIGDFDGIPVIEVLANVGDVVKKNDSLITLESDKASMEVPSSADGTILEMLVKVGDKVSKGTVIARLSSAATSATAAAAPAPVIPSVGSAAAEVEGQPPASTIVELTVPDIGDFADIPVIEVLIKPGDAIEKEASLVTLESDKASMEVPASASGTVQEVRVKVGDKVGKGSVIATLVVKGVASVPIRPSTTASPTLGMTSAALAPAPAPLVTAMAPNVSGPIHASPSIRRFARELGVDLRGVRGTGPNARVTREDVQGFVKSALAGGASPGGSVIAGLPPWPKVDFAQFGPIERTPLSRIKRISGPALHRNWVQIPHITNYDEADITDLEAFRNEINTEQTKSGGAKLTMLAFLVKAAVRALEKFPDFNASLDGDALIHKGYFNIGFAADTPNGLVVPVVKSADKKGLLEIAAESATLAGKARDGKLGIGDMQGGTFTISSIGGIGGTQFTQIVNAPEVAIMGATRSAIKPVWDGKAFVPRLIMPVSVSYDHRVIDGAAAARFLVYLTGLLEDYRRTAL